MPTDPTQMTNIELSELVEFIAKEFDAQKQEFHRLCERRSPSPSLIRSSLRRGLRTSLLPTTTTP